MRFTKMQAYGNDYVYIDAIHQELRNLPELARYVSDRHFAVGSDGMVLICSSGRGDFKMRMFNPDGTEGEMCGNALRSVGKYVYDHRLTDRTELVIETLGGMKHLTLTAEDGLVTNIRADIGKPGLSSGVIPVCTDREDFIDQDVAVLDRIFKITAVSWGNPHCVIYTDDVDGLDLENIGPGFERHAYFPNRVNTEFVKVLDRHTVQMRVWERGSGETLACGTGACAVTVACILNGFTERNVTVRLRGGDLHIEWDQKTDTVFMTGPATEVFEGEIA